MLGTNHCGELRRTAFKYRELFQDVLCCRDFAERVVASFARQRRGPAQDVPFFYTPSQLSELKSCKSIVSTNISIIFIFK